MRGSQAAKNIYRCHRLRYLQDKILVPRRALKTRELTKSSITLSSEEESSGEASCDTVNRDVSISKNFNDISRAWFDDDRFSDLPSFFARFL